MGAKWTVVAEGPRAAEFGRTHRILTGVVVAGAVVMAGIGFAGSYAAVRELAERHGFGSFSLVFPIGIDAGICVLLALDLLLRRPALLKHHVHQREVHHLRQLAYMARRVHAPAASIVRVMADFSCNGTPCLTDSLRNKLICQESRWPVPAPLGLRFQALT